MRALRLLVPGARSWLWLSAAALLAALTYLSGIGLLGLSGWLISRAAQHPDPSALTLAAVGVRAVGLSRGLLRYAERVVGHSVTLRIIAELRVQVFEGLVAGGVRRAGPAQTAGLLSAVVTDVDAVQDLLLRCAVPFAAGCLVLLAGSVAGFVLLPAAALVLTAGLGTALLVVPAVGCVVARAEVGLAGRRADYQAQLLELAQGCPDLLVMGAMPAALDQADAAAGRLAAMERRGAPRSAAVSALMGLLQGATVLGVLAVSLQAVTAGSLPPPLVAVVALVALACFEPVAPLAEAGSLLPRTVGAARRLADLLAVDANPEAVRAAGPGSHLTAWGAGLCCPDTDRPALQEIDLDLPAGSHVALVGASGAGKSSLLHLLAGQERPTSGQVLLAGVPAHLLGEQERSELVVVADQAAHLFHTSVLGNLRLGRPAAELSELRAAVQVAGLGDWVDALPRGWSAPVGEHGGRLSGGERKRLVLARALLSRAPVLLLDEPTEGLDPVAADALLRRLVASCRDRTLLVVTHRLAALEYFDRVVVLDRGRIVQQGPPAQLSACAGPFRELHDRQQPSSDRDLVPCSQPPQVASLGS